MLYLSEKFWKSPRMAMLCGFEAALAIVRVGRTVTKTVVKRERRNGADFECGDCSVVLQSLHEAQDFCDSHQ